MEQQIQMNWDHSLWSSMVSWLEQAYPAEGCGLILVDESGSITFRRCDNVIDKYHEFDSEQYPRTSRDFYMIDPREFMAAEERGDQVAVIVHSHPDTGHYFSDSDIEAALMPRDSDEDPIEPLYPGTDYLVVSVCEGQAVGASLYRFDTRKKEFFKVDTVSEEGLQNRVSRTEHEEETAV